MPARHDILSPVGVIAAGGAMPFAVADALVAGGSAVVVFGIEGLCDPAAVANYRHHWIAVAQFGRLFRLLAAENVRDLVMIGTMIRPAMRDLRFDWTAIKMIPEIRAALRGGDDQVLVKVGRVFERRGFRLLGLQDVAPDMLMPEGLLTRVIPDASATADIAVGVAVLRALSPFDIGQAVVVIDRHVVGVEGIEGTDALLSRVAQLRAERRIRKASGRGVLVKAPKAGQDLRFDLPTVGPQTVAGVAGAELGGIAVTAGRAIAAESEAIIRSADRAGLFVIGIAP